MQPDPNDVRPVATSELQMCQTQKTGRPIKLAYFLILLLRWPSLGAGLQFSRCHLPCMR